MSYLYNSLPKNELNLQKIGNSTIRDKSVKMVIRHKMSRELLDSLSSGMIQMLKKELLNKMK